jgi:hypothetical protein
MIEPLFQWSMSHQSREGEPYIICAVNVCLVGIAFLEKAFSKGKCDAVGN